MNRKLLENYSSRTDPTVTVRGFWQLKLKILERSERLCYATTAAAELISVTIRQYL
ncbi:MAG: hypothetical protein F6K47_32920 [Symploca sp. SIO2E6]|nr:hypothetical protein [Symploca sp. SIO2E6]